MTEPDSESTAAGEIIQRRVLARRAEREALMAEFAPQANYDAPERPAGRNPEIGHFRQLQARIDEAQTALTAVRTNREASKFELADAQQALDAARAKVQRTIDNAENPQQAAALAYSAAQDHDRPTRPASIGDLAVRRRDD
ncbi:hypothetical protein [Amycolatopsis eburnea]|uniref:Uncharacterized protein n=1 Tax=Amycolatopsis eburnea TaxID=2267691 RepID=A0A3R9E5L7_9PSEU|nr:hypothetical protein [Amycolatopsis eburnea]RSD23946.1 hypothetical protein EIY87_06135 [Amycolatopsis eburnea]